MLRSDRFLRVRRWCSLFFRFVLSGCLLCIFCFGGSSFLGYQKFVVVSGSMAPSVPVGACILVKEKEACEIESGEILTFYINDRKTVVTHRVVENDCSAQLFRTKGDANPYPDASSVSYQECIGTVRYIIPRLGYLLVFLNSVYGKAASACLLLLGIATTILWRAVERSILET